ncbi:MAG: DNA polymerase III subunit gamma/tau [Planctomycetes bacterium]|nr:DNA polymerase III subunit gamma/tau [Planctomycetota bacterium]
MSYLVLARKYRPGTFADLVGQEVVARTLQGAIEEQRVGHAYLFCGPRGTGKTTTARLVAKALNCVHGPTANPCGTCEHCLGIEKGSDPDLIEMDAASNRRIEDVRELRENVAYAPMKARFKVYIVDEVHMLTKEAFNALLKTLEEPPRHVKFLLATTDPQKVPATILSRCQILRLAPLAEAVIAARLEHVFAAEGVAAEAGVALEIARRARGGMRDALSMADQLLSLVGTRPQVADLERLAADGGADLADLLLARLAAADRAGVLAALPVGEGGEPELVGTLLDRLRAMLLLALLGRDAVVVALDEGERAALHERAAAIGTARLAAWIEELVLARERMARLPSHARVVLEIALLDMARPESGFSFADLERRLVALETRLAPAAGGTGTAPAVGGVRPAAAAGAPDDLLPRPPAREAAPRAPGGRAYASSEPPARAPAARDELPRPSTSPAGTRSAPAPLPASPPRSRAAAEPPDADLAPERETEAEQRPPSDVPRPRVAGHAAAWEGFLQALAKTSSSLADTLRARGRLSDLANGRALVLLSNLREAERVAISDAQNRRRCSAVFSAVLGATVEVVLEDQAAARKSRDPYTGKVAELFGGRIEDEG